MLVIFFKNHNSFSVLLYYCTFYTAMLQICCCWFFSFLKQFYSFWKSLIHASHILVWRERGKEEKTEIKQKTGCERGESKWKEGERKKTTGGENKLRNYANTRNQSHEPEGQTERRDSSLCFGGAYPTGARAPEQWGTSPVRTHLYYFQYSWATR